MMIGIVTSTQDLLTNTIQAWWILMTKTYSYH